MLLILQKDIFPSRFSWLHQPSSEIFEFEEELYLPSMTNSPAATGKSDL